MQRRVVMEEQPSALEHVAEQAMGGRQKEAPARSLSLVSDHRLCSLLLQQVQQRRLAMFLQETLATAGAAAEVPRQAVGRGVES